MATIKGIDDLKKILKKELGNTIEISEVYPAIGRIEALVNGYFVAIHIRPQKTLFICGSEETPREILDLVVPALNKAMDNNKPIARFDIREYGNEKDIPAPYIEWNIINPEERLKELANNRGVGERAEVLNLEILNGKTINDYLDTKEETQELMKNSKVYGIYSAFIDPAKNAITPEYVIYMSICQLESEVETGEILNRIGLFGHIDIEDKKYALDFFKQSTTRFGVEMREPVLEKRVVETSSYSAWKAFWYNHFKDFTKEQLDTLFDIAMSNGDASEYLPNCDWKDAIERTMKPNNGQKDEQ